MIYLVTRQSALFNSNLFEHIELIKAIEILSELDEIALDTETGGLDPYTKKLLLLQLGNEHFQVLFDINSYDGIIPIELKEFLNNSSKLYILQNAKFDLKFLFHQGIILKKVYDTMLAEIIITNGLQYFGRDLKSLTQKYCGEELDKSVRGEIINKGLNDAVLLYGARDVEFLPTIKRKQLAYAKELNLLKAIELDCSFVIPLAYVEYCGIKLNFEKWSSRTSKNISEAADLKKELEEQLLRDGKLKYFSGMLDLFSGEQDCIINWDSPKQVIELFKNYGINTTIKIKGESKETIDAKVLEPQKDQFTILPPYLKYKAKQKEISTYGMGWKKFINPVTGRIHTTFQQLMDTSRLSCGNKNDGTPNLQNIPSDFETRSCFIPEPGNYMIDADYSGQETIVLVNASKEPNLITFYSKGLDDMHSYVAFLMYEDIRPCTLEEVDKSTLDYIKSNHKNLRQIAKSAGFAIAYGGNGSTIAKNCNISVKDGEFVYNSYFKAFPEMKNYFHYVFQKAAYYGYVEFNPITKRKYFFDKDKNDYFALKDQVEDPYFWNTATNPKSIMGKYDKAKNDIQRLSQNYPIQGTSADITKYACIIFFREILKRGWWMKVKIVNLVHDEILVECPIDLVEEVKEVLVTSMEEAGKPFCSIVPLYAEAIHGDHWVH